MIKKMMMVASLATLATATPGPALASGGASNALGHGTVDYLCPFVKPSFTWLHWLPCFSD